MGVPDDPFGYPGWRKTTVFLKPRLRRWAEPYGTVTRYLPKEWVIEFAIVYPGTHGGEARYFFLKRGDGGSTVVHWTRTYTGLNETGNRILETLHRGHVIGDDGVSEGVFEPLLYYRDHAAKG